MSFTVTEPDVSTPDHRTTVRRRWPAAAAALGVLALLAAVLLVWNRGDEAPAAFPSGLGSFFSTVPIAVGDTWLAGVAVDLPTVTVLDAEPVVTAGSAAAAMEVVACERQPGAAVMGAGVGDIQDFCVRTHDVDGLDLSSLESDAYLMLVVVPLAEGPVEVEGIEITYRDEHGERSQLAGGTVSLPAP